MREKHSRYSTVSIVLHWTIAILIIANATFGGWMEDASDSEKLGYYQLHKSVGITILALSLIRLGWRFGHPWPAFPGGMPSWERLLARTTHILFYVLMIGAPLLGWAAASAGGAPEVPLYGAVPAPNLPLPLNAGSKPAARLRSISPSDTASTITPSARIRRRMCRLEQAFCA